MNRKVTMQDIADHIGISKNSVSQALSGKSGVSEKTRKQVFKVADELGYIYKPRQSRSTDFKNIALIASDFAFSKTFFSEIYLSVQSEAKKNGMNFFIESISPEAAKNLTLPSFLNDERIHGIIILSHITTEYIKKVKSTGIPTILIDHHHPHIDADAILTNNNFGAYLAIEYLIKNDHKNIGFLGDASFSPSYYERLQGYFMALDKYQIPVQEQFILRDVPDDEIIVEKAIDQLKELPTAWFCVNDQLGYIVNSLLKQRGYQIPKDVSIFSFDNGQLSQMASPRISSMDIDLSLYGKKGFELLLWRINNPDEPIREILFMPTLVEGQSVGMNQNKIIDLG